MTNRDVGVNANPVVHRGMDSVLVPAAADDAPVVCVVSGHRHGLTSAQKDWALDCIEYCLVHLRTVAARNGRGLVCMTGMALGIDLQAASRALRLGIPLHAVVPYWEQDAGWDRKGQKLYGQVIQGAWRATVLRSGTPKSRAQAGQWLTDRNRWMAEYAAVRPGSAACVVLLPDRPGGTQHAFQEYLRVHLPVCHIDPGAGKCTVPGVPFPE